MKTDEDTESPIDNLLTFAWTVIANAGGGDWSRESAEWQEAARKWRDDYRTYLVRPNVPDRPFELISGTPLSGGDFVLKLSTDQVSLTAWALIRYVDEFPINHWTRVRCQDLAYAFAALSGDH